MWGSALVSSNYKLFYACFSTFVSSCLAFELAGLFRILILKMPDAFESAYPLSPSVNPQDIRARANSSSKNKRPVITFIAGNEAVEIPDKSLVGVDKPLMRVDKSEVELDSFAESLSTMHSTWFDKRVLQHRYVNI